MRLFGLGLFLVACGGSSADFSASSPGAAGAGGVTTQPSSAGTAGAAGAEHPEGASGGADVAESGSTGLPEAGAPSSSGQGGASMASAGTPSAGTGGMSLGGVGGSAAGAPSSAGTGGAMCVARKACADAGTIVNNCVPCDQKHCGDIDDGCSGVIECGTCPGSSNACSTAHECKSLTAGCSEYQGLYGNVCVQFPQNNQTQTFWCPKEPQTNSCAFDGSCWKCNGAK